MDEPEQQQWDGSAKWQGTAEPLLTILTKVAGERVANSREWPKKPKGLGGRLREAAPNLRKLGMNISFDRTGKRGTRVITVVQGAQSDKGEDASAASDAAANGADTDDINDMIAGRRADTCVSQSAQCVGHAQCVSRYLVEKITRPTLPTLPRPTSSNAGLDEPSRNDSVWTDPMIAGRTPEARLKVLMAVVLTPLPFAPLAQPHAPWPALRDHGTPT